MDTVTSAPTADAMKELLKPNVPKSKKKPAAKKAKVGKRLVKAAKKARTKSAACRLSRLDMRLSQTEKDRVTAKAKKLRRTITSVVMEAIEKIK